jgi:ComEC/Rec2-related protein
MASAVLNTEPTLYALLKLSSTNRGIPLEEWIQGLYNDSMRLRISTMAAVFTFLAAGYALPSCLPPASVLIPAVSALTAGLFRRTRSLATLMVIITAASAGASLERPAPQRDVPGRRGGVWTGTIGAVTGSGAMVSTGCGEFWCGSRTLASAVTRGDSVRVLGSVSGGFLDAACWEVFPCRSVLNLIRALLRRTWADRIASRSASSLVCALLMGDRSTMPPGIRLLFRETGASHLLAVSGLHAGLAGGAVLLLAGGARRSGLRTLAVLLPVLLCYTLLTGARPSTIRASLMMASAVWMSLRSGRPCYLSIWCVAALLLTALVPGVMNDRGAQLSFAAVLSLILLSRGFGGGAGLLLTPLYAGMTVTVALAPLVMHTFGALPVQAPLATVVSMPFLLATMVLGVMVLLPILAPGASLLLEWCVWSWTGLLGLLRLPLLRMEGRFPLLPWAAAVVLLLLLRWRRGFHRRFR